MRLEAHGPSIKSWVNDVPAATLEDDMTSSGFIALQVHSTQSTQPLEVRWRNLRIKELPSNAASATEAAGSKTP